jgi:hypothetical protein
MRHRVEQCFEPVHLRALLQQRDRLLAVGGIVIDQGDLLAFELVEPAFALGDVLQNDVPCVDAPTFKDAPRSVRSQFDDCPISM